MVIKRSKATDLGKRFYLFTYPSTNFYLIRLKLLTVELVGKAVID